MNAAGMMMLSSKALTLTLLSLLVLVAVNERCRVMAFSRPSFTTTRPVTSSSFRLASSSTQTNNNNIAAGSSSSAPSRHWQDDLEELLSPATSPARRQILLQQLLNETDDIRASVEQALQDRKIDPLLTPTGKKLQEGTQAVARQLSNDILPMLAKRTSPSYSSSSSQKSSSNTSPVFPIMPPAPSELQKVGTRVLNAVSNQVQKNLETLAQDLQDPTRIPQRLSQQTQDLVKEASNVLRETPVGLQEPPYTVVMTTPDYEIRDYQAYKVASTNMAPAGEKYDVDDVAQTGTAFNSLAAYLFGANRESRSMEMTTPVTTTLSGEMRFYLYDDVPPDPLEQDESNSIYETRAGSILIQDIPPARLAVRRFTGFVTEGEIARQKQALLTALQLDGVELDVPHGQAISHVIFQYNPPYTLPVIRRNEIAVAVRKDEEAHNNIEQEWTTDNNDESSAAPSD